jgi:hypothetical protein
MEPKQSSPNIIMVSGIPIARFQRLTHWRGQGCGR